MGQTQISNLVSTLEFWNFLVLSTYILIKYCPSTHLRILMSVIIFLHKICLLFLSALFFVHKMSSILPPFFLGTKCPQFCPLYSLCMKCPRLFCPLYFLCMKCPQFFGHFFCAQRVSNKPACWPFLGVFIINWTPIFENP